MITLEGGDQGEEENFHFSFCAFLDCLHFPAKKSPILVQFLNVNRGCLSDEMTGHFLVVVKKATANIHHFINKRKVRAH